ncbi:MAG: hypothetical protein KC613_15715, partial [Myxococcales bacterium]|nr:hypothetical protein [Myxococcales bacterium]
MPLRPLPLLAALTFTAPMLTGCEPTRADDPVTATDGGAATDGALVGDGDGGAVDAEDAAAPIGLPVRHVADAEAAARGEAWFTQGALGGGLIPAQALRHIYMAWPLGDLQKLAYFQDADRFWVDFRARYGLHPAPFDNGPYPLGLRDAGNGTVALDCLACHAGAVDGQVVLGLGNSAFDLQGLYDDLWRLPAELQALRERDLPEPYASLVRSFPEPDDVQPIAELAERSAAAGHNDAFGLGLALSLRLRDAELHTEFGPQDPAPWWTLKVKDRLYADGLGRVGGSRTLMATLLASGLDRAALAALDDDFGDIEQWLLSLPAPAWPGPTPDAAQVARGRAVFDAECAACHGRYDGPEGHFPDRVVPHAEVGTDPLRAERFGAAEAAHVNALIRDPAHAVEPTGGYLAPVLTGVWASAPYLHNGSVP